MIRQFGREFGAPEAEEWERAGFPDAEVSWVFDAEGTESPRARAFRVSEAGFVLLWVLYLRFPRVRGLGCLRLRGTRVRRG